jgi:hypothetical protein
MKQKLDEARTLAIKLYEAGQKAKRKQPSEIWGVGRETKWRDLPSESMAVWDAVAICAYDELKRQNDQAQRPGHRDVEQT